jgi:hypothetical protein
MSIEDELNLHLLKPNNSDEFAPVLGITVDKGYACGSCGSSNDTDYCMCDGGHSMYETEDVRIEHSDDATMIEALKELKNIHTASDKFVLSMIKQVPEILPAIPKEKMTDDFCKKLMEYVAKGKPSSSSNGFGKPKNLLLLDKHMPKSIKNQQYYINIAKITANSTYIDNRKLEMLNLAPEEMKNDDFYCEAIKGFSTRSKFLEKIPDEKLTDNVCCTYIKYNNIDDNERKEEAYESLFCKLKKSDKTLSNEIVDCMIDTVTANFNGCEENHSDYIYLPRKYKNVENSIKAVKRKKGNMKHIPTTVRPFVFFKLKQEKSKNNRRNLMQQRDGR